MTMSLLTPTESYAFQSFLEHIDVNDALDISHDWPAVYSAGAVGVVAPTGRAPDGGVVIESVADVPVPVVSNEQLAKAAKDLMSLDSNPRKWSESADRDILLPRPRPLRPAPSTPLVSTSSLGKLGAYSSHNSMPRLAARPSPGPAQSHSPGIHRSQDPSRNSMQSTVTSSSSISSDTSPSPSTPPYKRSFDEDDQPQPQASSSRLGLHNTVPARVPASASSSGSGSSSSISNSIVSPTDLGQSAKKSRPSPPHQSGTVLSSKPALLTPSQKKFNHIQSEQKRRANIRRGYDALCETVPALREAIRLEEEANASATQVNDAARSKKKSRGRKKIPIDGLERQDGRAGPRSENVVLAKTIDYINELLAGRSELVGRLEVLRSVAQASGKGNLCLPQDLPPDGVPLWEREWTGGMGILDDGKSESESDDDNDS